MANASPASQTVNLVTDDSTVGFGPQYRCGNIAFTSYVPNSNSITLTH